MNKTSLVPIRTLPKLFFWVFLSSPAWQRQLCTTALRVLPAALLPHLRALCWCCSWATWQCRKEEVAVQAESCTLTAPRPAQLLPAESPCRSGYSSTWRKALCFPTPFVHTCQECWWRLSKGSCQWASQFGDGREHRGVAHCWALHGTACRRGEVLLCHPPQSACRQQHDSTVRHLRAHQVHKPSYSIFVCLWIWFPWQWELHFLASMLLAHICDVVTPLAYINPILLVSPHVPDQFSSSFPAHLHLYLFQHRYTRTSHCYVYTTDICKLECFGWGVIKMVNKSNNCCASRADTDWGQPWLSVSTYRWLRQGWVRHSVMLGVNSIRSGEENFKWTAGKSSHPWEILHRKMFRRKKCTKTAVMGSVYLQEWMARNCSQTAGISKLVVMPPEPRGGCPDPTSVSTGKGHLCESYTPTWVSQLHSWEPKAILSVRNALNSTAFIHFQCCA